MLELSADNTSDQKFSSISETYSCVSILFIHMLLLFSLVVTVETSLLDSGGEAGLLSAAVTAGLRKFMGSCCSFLMSLDESTLDLGCPLLSMEPWFGFSLFFKWVCHTFLISLSVRPGNLAAIADHLQENQNLLRPRIKQRDGLAFGSNFFKNKRWNDLYFSVREEKKLRKLSNQIANLE